MQEFCETSSNFERGKVKNEAILRDVLNFRSWQHQNEPTLGDFLQKSKSECRADGLVPMRFAILPCHLSKALRLPRNSDARSYEVLHLSRKIIFPKLKIWCSKMQQSAPGPPNIPAVRFFNTSTSKIGPRMVCFVPFDLEMCFAPQRRAIFHLSSGQMPQLHYTTLLHYTNYI